MASESGTQLGRYTLLGKIATGGMAEVFLARQEGPSGFAKTLVVKRILPHLAKDESFVKMFLDEARLAAVINHPNVVSIYELGVDDATHTYYMAMEYIDGCNLKRVIHDSVRAHIPFPPALCARVIADACAGLEYAHNLKGENRQPLGIVHRDISPENILVTYSGLVKVVDFGIAKAASIEGGTQAGQVKGKFSYMPPEQLLGKPLDRRADVWALGIVLYWMCTGVKPFGGDNEAVIIQKILGSDPDPIETRVPGLPPRLAEIIYGTLQKKPDDRYASARALQQDLEAWLVADGLTATSAALSDYMNLRFPEATDRDRQLVRALQSGELQQNTPSETDLASPFKAAGGGATKTASSVSRQRAQVPEKPARNKMLLIGLGAAGLVVVGGTAAVFALRNGDDAEVAAAPMPAPAPVPEPAIAPPPPAVAAPAPPVAPTGALPPTPGKTAPAAAPVAAAAPSPAPTPAPAAPPPAVPAVAAAPAKPMELNLNDAPAPAAHKAKPAHHRAAEAAAPAPAEEPAPAAPRAGSRGEGSISVRVSPWATVFVDGQRVGTTPMEPIDVPAGVHKVRLVNDPLHAERIMTVDVKPGETASVKAMLGNE